MIAALPLEMPPYSPPAIKQIIISNSSTGNYSMFFKAFKHPSLTSFPQVLLFYSFEEIILNV